MLPLGRDARHIVAEGIGGYVFFEISMGCFVKVADGGYDISARR